MSTVNPENSRQSNGAAWARNGQRQRLNTLDGQKEGSAMLITRKRGTGSKRPCDAAYARISTRGFVFAGRWYPDGHPVGALRFLLPAGEPVQAEPSIGDRWGAEFHPWEPDDLAWRMHFALILFRSYKALEATRPPYSVIEARALGIAALLGIAGEQIPRPSPEQVNASNHTAQGEASCADCQEKVRGEVEMNTARRIRSVGDVDRLLGKPGDHGLAEMDFGKQKARVLDRATEIVEAVRYAGAHPEIPEARELPHGFELVEDGKKTNLVHPAARGVVVTVAFKGNFDLNFPEMWDVTRGEVIKLCWAVEHASPDAKLAAMAPRTRIYAMHGDTPRELTFVGWSDEGMRFVNELGNDSTISLDEVGEALRAKKLRIDGEMPEQIRALAITSGSHYQRDTSLFVAHNARGSGGGFIPFCGDIRKWAWVRRNCVCFECGASIGNFKSGERADGFIPNARYFTCQGVGRHIIRRETDLRWKVGAEARDKKRRLKATVEDVQAAYPWLNAIVPESEEVPY